MERWVYTNKAGLVVEKKREDCTWEKIQVREEEPGGEREGGRGWVGDLLSAYSQDRCSLQPPSMLA